MKGLTLFQSQRAKGLPSSRISGFIQHFSNPGGLVRFNSSGGIQRVQIIKPVQAIAAEFSGTDNEVRKNETFTLKRLLFLHTIDSIYIFGLFDEALMGGVAWPPHCTPCLQKRRREGRQRCEEEWSFERCFQPSHFLHHRVHHSMLHCGGARGEMMLEGEKKRKQTSFFFLFLHRVLCFFLVFRPVLEPR